MPSELGSVRGVEPEDTDRFEVDERLNAQGEVLTPLAQHALDDLCTRIGASGVESVAVCLLHAYANDAHEVAARDAIRKKFPELFVSISSEVAPQIREYERTSTTVANAYIKPLADSYLDLMGREIARLGGSVASMVPAPARMPLLVNPPVF